MIIREGQLLIIVIQTENYGFENWILGLKSLYWSLILLKRKVLSQF